MALALGAPALKDAPRGERAVVGEWQMESMTVNGRPRAVGADPLRYAFTADGLWFTFRGGRRPATTDRAYFTNPRANPPTLDLKYDAAEQDGTIVLGIYKVVGDTLTICLRRGTGDRPTAFESSADVRTTLYTFRRVKPTD
jgi:uncharacterized protein (TIGR03067 family)